MDPLIIKTIFLGTLRAGAVFLPLNTAYTPAELGPLLADALYL